MVGVEIVGNHGCRCVFTMGCSEGIVYVDIGIGCKLLGKIFLTILHLGLCGVVFGRAFFNANGFAFFLSIVAKIFQQQGLASFER